MARSGLYKGLAELKDILQRYRGLPSDDPERGKLERGKLERGKLAGCVANRSRETNEIDCYCDRVGFKRLAHMPDIDAIRRSRLKKRTLFEMPEDDDIRLARAEHMAGAATLWAGTEPLAPQGLPDREIFEMPGFD